MVGGLLCFREFGFVWFVVLIGGLLFYYVCCFSFGLVVVSIVLGLD